MSYAYFSLKTIISIVIFYGVSILFFIFNINIFMKGIFVIREIH
jgi:hypothetical protein